MRPMAAHRQTCLRLRSPCRTWYGLPFRACHAHYVGTCSCSCVTRPRAPCVTHNARLHTGLGMPAVRSGGPLSHGTKPLSSVPLASTVSVRTSPSTFRWNPSVLRACACLRAIYMRSTHIGAVGAVKARAAEHRLSANRLRCCAILLCA